MRPRLGISACLLGESVRHDGAHKRCAVLLERLVPFVEVVAVCPEVEAGLGVPREPMRLEAQGEAVRVRTVTTRADLTERLEASAVRRVQALEHLGLSGFVLKARSPSCGSGSTAVEGRSEPGSGVFAAALARRLPWLPLVEETALEVPAAREAFVTALFALARFQALAAHGLTLGGLRAFHEAHRWLLLSRGGPALLAVEAEAGRSEPDPARYREALVAALARPADPRVRLHALMHAAEPLRRRLEQAGLGADLERLAEAVTAYMQGRSGFEGPAHEVRRLAAAHGLNDLAEDLLLTPCDDGVGLLRDV